MPVMTHLGPAAPCGLHRYETDQFGTEYANNLFCCQFNLRKVSRHVLVADGLDLRRRRTRDFVVSDNLDFHPTDVIEDADGSLLVVDTGGWYKLCCPTSQLVKPDVTGARVKKVGAHQVVGVRRPGAHGRVDGRFGAVHAARPHRRPARAGQDSGVVVAPAGFSGLGGQHCRDPEQLDLDGHAARCGRTPRRGLHRRRPTDLGGGVAAHGISAGAVEVDLSDARLVDGRHHGRHVRAVVRSAARPVLHRRRPGSSGWRSPSAGR